MRLKHFSAALTFLALSLLLVSCTYVTFDGGDAGVFTSTSFAPSPPENMTLDGYIFDGWYYDTEYKNAYNLGDKLSNNITLYAKWIPKEYTVKFVLTSSAATDDTELLTQKVKHGEKAQIPYIEHKAFKQTAVSGWFLDESHVTKWDPDSPVTGDLTVYYTWGEYEQSVYFTAPVVYIQTYDNKKITSTEKYLSCNVSIGNTDESPLSNVSAKIRGRGNTTWHTISDKKAYRVKFDKKTDLFGMGKEKDYLLIANYIDYTLMRNDLVYQTATELGLEYTTKTEWVHLYLNGKYEGVYMLCEQTETGKHRVNIGKDDEPGNSEKSGDEIGFLLEVDGAGDYEDNRYFKFKTIRTKEKIYAWRDHFTVNIKSPDGEYITNEQYEYIKEYVTKVNRAICLRDWKTFCEMCDVDSFVNSFIINQISFSVDMGWAFFLYKPSGEKLHYGPAWDYDQSFGNSTHGGTVYNSWRSGEENMWFTWLCEMEQFRDAVKKRWNEVYEDTILSMDKRITEMYNRYKGDAHMNFIRWDIIGEEYWRSPKAITELETYEENVSYLREWLQKRISYMNSEISKW